MKSYRYKIYPELKLIAAKFTGVIDASFLKQSIVKLSSDTLFNDEYNGIIDFREARASEELSLFDLKEIAENIQSAFQNKKSKSAILVKELGESALALLFQGYVGGREYKAFNDKPTACSWLNISQPLPESDLHE